MKIGQVMYCVNESSYSNLLTKGEKYEVKAIDTEYRKVRVKGDSGRTRWVYQECLAENPAPKIIKIQVDDPIQNSLNDYVEVSIFFDNGEKRYTNFMTILYLQKQFMNPHREYYEGNKTLFVKELIEEDMIQVIIKLDKKNELIEHCILY